MTEVTLCGTKDCPLAEYCRRSTNGTGTWAKWIVRREFSITGEKTWVCDGFLSRLGPNKEKEKC